MSKNILITGCSSGMGLVAAHYLHTRGYKVYAGCRKNEDVVRMNSLGFHGVQIDLDDSLSIDTASKKIIELSGGRLNALFNNAGYGLYGNLNTLPRERLEKQFSTNFFGMHQLTMNLLPALQSSGDGRIIITSSVLGILSTPGRGAYAASKFAVEAWADALRMELKEKGVKISLLEPGPINTSFTHNVAQGREDKPVLNPKITARFALPAEAILPKLEHALESRKPRLRYPITLVAYLISIMKRVLPGRMLDVIFAER